MINLENPVILSKLTLATWRAAGGLSPGVVGVVGGDGNQFVFFDDVGREVVAVDAAGVEADRFGAAAGFGRGPVAEKHDFVSVINFIPRRPVVTLSILPERAH